MAKKQKKRTKKYNAQKAMSLMLCAKKRIYGDYGYWRENYKHSISLSYVRIIDGVATDFDYSYIAGLFRAVNVLINRFNESQEISDALHWGYSSLRFICFNTDKSSATVKRLRDGIDYAFAVLNEYTSEEYEECSRVAVSMISDESEDPMYQGCTWGASYDE